MKPDSGDHLFHSGSDLEDTILDGVKLRLCPFAALQAFLGQSMKKHVRGAMKKEPELIGFEAVT